MKKIIIILGVILFSMNAHGVVYQNTYENSGKLPVYHPENIETLQTLSVMQQDPTISIVTPFVELSEKKVIDANGELIGSLLEFLTQNEATSDDLYRVLAYVLRLKNIEEDLEVNPIVNFELNPETMQAKINFGISGQEELLNVGIKVKESKLDYVLEIMEKIKTEDRILSAPKYAKKLLEYLIDNINDPLEVKSSFKVKTFDPYANPATGWDYPEETSMVRIPEDVVKENLVKFGKKLSNGLDNLDNKYPVGDMIPLIHYLDKVITNQNINFSPTIKIGLNNRKGNKEVAVKLGLKKYQGKFESPENLVLVFKVAKGISGYELMKKIGGMIHEINRLQGRGAYTNASKRAAEALELIINKFAFGYDVDLESIYLEK